MELEAGAKVKQPRRGCLRNGFTLTEHSPDTQTRACGRYCCLLLHLWLLRFWLFLLIFQETREILTAAVKNRLSRERTAREQQTEAVEIVGALAGARIRAARGRCVVCLGSRGVNTAGSLAVDASGWRAASSQNFWGNLSEIIVRL